MGLLDQLNDVLLQTPRKYWGDKATRLGSLLGDAASTGAQAYGSANSPMAPEHSQTLAGLLADFTPVVGDVKSAYDGMNAAREGDYLWAALGGLGALPLVPNLAGWTVHKMGDIKILENPTREMVKNLANKSRYEEVRGLVDPNNGKQYWWDAGSLNHKDVSDWLGIDWSAIEKGSDQTRKMMRSTAIDGTPWKFAEE